MAEAGSRACLALVVIAIIGTLMTPPLLGWKLHQIRQRIKVYGNVMATYNATYAVTHAINLVMCQDRTDGPFRMQYVGGNRTLAFQFIEAVMALNNARSIECSCQQVTEVFGPSGKIADLFDNGVDCDRAAAWMDLTHRAWFRDYGTSGVSVTIKDPTSAISDMQAQAEGFVVGLAVVSVAIGVVVLTTMLHACSCSSGESRLCHSGSVPTAVSYPAVEPADSVSLNIKPGKDIECK